MKIYSQIFFLILLFCEIAQADQKVCGSLNADSTDVDIARCKVEAFAESSPGQAQNSYRRILKLRPNDVDARIDYGTTLIKLGDNKSAKTELKGALTTLDKAIEANPKDEKLYFRRAMLFYGVYLFDLAIKDFEKAASLSGDNLKYKRQVEAATHLKNSPKEARLEPAFTIEDLRGQQSIP